MTDFVMRDSERDRVPSTLTREIPGFASSEQYEMLDSREREIPGLVCAALARYWLRLQGEEQAGGQAGGSAEPLASIYRTVETLAASDDREVQNLVVTEILENLDANELLVPQIKSRLGEHARALHDRWLD